MPFLDSKSLKWEAHPNYDSNESILQQNEAVQAAQEVPEGDRHYLREWRQVWRRKHTTPQVVQELHVASQSQSSGPLAQAGVNHPPYPVARSPDSNKELNFLLDTQTAHTMTPPGEGSRKLVARIPEALLATLRSHCREKASVSLLGRIHGKHPGLKALTAWARETLHPTLSLLSLKSNNVFEVTFAKAEGRKHALNLTDLVCESAAIYFSSWRPHFDPRNPRAADKLDHPVWVQIVDLCQVLREDIPFLQTIGEQLGQVISIDNSDAYKAKLSGPRIRILVQDLTELPSTVEIPRLDGDGTLEYKLEFSGLPNQCGRCRSHEHQVRHCPKKESHNRRADNNHGHKTPQTTKQLDQREVDSVMQKVIQAEQEPIIPYQCEEKKPIDDTAPSLKSSTAPHSKEATPPVVLAADLSSDTTETPTGTIDLQVRETEEVIEHSTDSPSLFPTIPADEINFPKLSSPARTDKEVSPQPSEKSTLSEPPQFIWRSQPNTPDEPTRHKEQDKGKIKIPDSTPITRQGYRTGRLAEDFWVALKTPNTPSSSRKTLQVIPLLIKDRQQEPAEYLVSSKSHSLQPIARVHIAELLAGVPWTETSAKSHVVSEVAHALHKIFVFTNKVVSPLQKWSQGSWYATWDEETVDEYVCTLYVTILAQEAKLKPRKGHTVSWKRAPAELWSRLQEHSTETIADGSITRTLWQTMVPNNQESKESQLSVSTSPNRFAVLSEDDGLTQPSNQ